MKAPWVLLLISASLAAQSRTPVFDEEFNGALLDLSRWTSHEPQPGVPNPRVHTWLPEAVTLSGGQLHIAVPANSPDHAGGIVTTYGIFAQRYGRFEVQFRAPAAPGVRAEFLLLPIPEGMLPGIDAFRISGDTPNRVALANHWGNEQTRRSYSDSFAVPDLSKGFHTVAVEWEPRQITWFVDGKKTFESTDGVPQQPMYLVLDLAVDKSAPPSSGIAPLPSFDIEYIRVYK